jgi:serine/tyrosine/threonine adenylyltransferase
MQGGWQLEKSYASLPEIFHSSVEPTPVRAPRMVIFNRGLAEFLGLDAAALDSSEGAEILAGNTLPPGAAPIAQAYAGHQYGHFTTLGDGRAILLGEQITPAGERLDVQLKGSGPTPYSRRGDGRAALGPMLREYIISEAMHALGIPSTRSLAVVATGETVQRDRALPGAVLTRIAASHIRVGTFEWAAARGGNDAVRTLVDYTLQRHFPDAAKSANPALALLDAVIERQARLIAQWLHVGFIHGVMNTDNMALSGETIDYGPCAFMDAYDPSTVFSSIDSRGRYAYGNQPAIAQWNLTRLAETLVPILDEQEPRAITLATESLQRFGERFQEHWLAGMRSKLGLFAPAAGDVELVQALLAWMHRTKSDYTNTFSRLEPDLAPNDSRRNDAEFMAWHERWAARLAAQSQPAELSRELRRSANPVVIPRNHLVESALTAATAGDLSVMERLLQVLSSPFHPGTDVSAYTEPGGSGDYQTFCGT